MIKGRIFRHNNCQVVILPPEAEFPDDVKEVVIRPVGQDRVISPANKTWDSFFLHENTVSDDFMKERS